MYFNCLVLMVNSSILSEDIFNKIPLGKPVDYVLAGYDLSGTVIEKIAPNISPDDTDIENLNQWIPPTEENPHPEFEFIKQKNSTEGVDDELNDKYILKFSLPTERDFDCKPNTTTNIKIKLF